MGEGPGELVDLSHVIRDGMETYPGLPRPRIETFLSREESRARYDPGTEFHIGAVWMVANTGTYLDAPFHRYAEGADIAHLPLESCVDIDGVVISSRTGDGDAVGEEALEGTDVSGRAVLFRTGWDRHFGTERYGAGHPHLTEGVARRLVEEGARLVGIDSVNVDDMSGGARPVHSTLLAANIPILEHLTRLDRLPARGFRVTALAPPIEGLGTFPVRAVARIVDPGA